MVKRIENERTFSNIAMKFGKVVNNAETETKDYAPAIQMGIEHAPTKLIVKYITDMYARPLDAALRETVSNALDAAYVAGKDADCVSVLLDKATGKFSVKDAGLGMDYDKLVNVYTQYGVSDKRDDGTSTGAFGLGAKSPLAYTNEFCVITKTKKDGCLFLRAYRTSEDDFIADLPVKVDGKVELTYYRDFHDNIMAPVLDANGNVVAPEFGYEHTEEIEDPFGKNETGTVVSFIIKDYHVNDAYDVVDAMSRTLRLSGDGSITDDKQDGELNYFCFGEKTLNDVDGDNISMKVFAPVDATSKYVSEVELRQLAGVFNIDQLEMKRIGFKVGNWIYPADGSIWDDNYHPVLLVDVPSKALPFVPSRDAIRRDSNYEDNASELANEAKVLVKDFLASDQNLESFINWGTDITGNFVSTFSYLLAHSMRDNLDDDGKIEVIGPDRRSWKLDPSHLTGFGKWSLQDLIQTTNIVAGVVDTPKSSMRNAGVYVSSNCDAARIVDGARNVIAADGSICYNLPGYALAKKKTVADNVDSASAPKAEEWIELSSKIENDRSVRPGNSQYQPHPAYPAGLAFMNLLCSSRYPVLLVDASEVGVRKARMGMVNMVKNSEAATGWSTCTYFMIPPKSDGKKWKQKELDEIRKMVEFFTDSRDTKLTYIPSDKVEEMSRKTENGKMKSSELEKMLSNCRVIEHIVEYDEDDMVVKDVLNTPMIKYDKTRCAKVMNENPTVWGFVVAKESHNNPLNVAQKYATVLMSLDMVPEYVERIVCMSERNFNKSRCDMVMSAGATVLFDESGKAGDDAYHDASVLSLQKEEPFYRDAKVIVKSRPSAEYLIAHDYDVAHKSDYDFAHMLKQALHIQWSCGMDSSQFSPKWVETITCGHETLPTYEQNEEYDLILGWKKNAFKNIVIDHEGFNQSAFASEYENAVSKVITAFEECSQLWAWCLDSLCLSLKLDKVDETTLDRLSQVADSLGVKSCIDSLYDGVPLEDIMA